MKGIITFWRSGPWRWGEGEVYRLGGNCCVSLDAAVRLVALVHVCVVLVDGLEAINLVMPVSWSCL